MVGGPIISEGVQILQHYSEVIGPGGPNTSKLLDRGELFQGGPFFRDSPSPGSSTEHVFRELAYRER